jgi:hypothetical protein
LPALFAIVFGGLLTLATSWTLGAVVLCRLPAPPEIRLATGAALLSTIIFALLLAGAAQWPIFLGIGIATLAASYWTPRAGLKAASALSLSRSERTAAALLFGGYGVFYFVNALAPEILADGITYHLGLVSEYTRTGAFPDRIAFYEMLPQGMEMLNVFAFSFGRHSAAKLVEFGCFASSFPLLFRIARRLGVSDLAALVAAALYFLAPVVAVSGTSSYTDAAQVFFALSAFYLLLVWHDTGDRRYVMPAGLLAGFCYSVKIPGLIVPALVLVYLLARRRWMTALIFSAGAAVAIAPWMIRAFVLTGNPAAPLLNAWFPNPFFHLATDRGLATDLHSLHGVTWWRVPWELAMGGKFTGIYGPLLLAVPVALLSLRQRAGRLCCLLALLLAVPWITNTSARFLMLAVPFAALAAGVAIDSLPRSVAWIAIIVQAVVCCPPVIAAWEPFYGFRLHEFPVAAALRLQPEPAYLSNRLDEYKVAGMIARNTPPDARILALLSVATAYTDRDIMVTWQSAEADQLLDTLRVGGLYWGDPFFDVAAEWPVQSLRAVRARLPRGYPGEWCIHEMQLFSGTDRVPNGRQWILRAWPNPAEAPLAFDLNPATRWRTWEPMRAGMYFEVELDSPQRLSGVTLLSHTPVFGVPFEFFGQSPDGHWIPLSASPKIVLRAKEDLRLAATHAVRRAGYRYILAPTGLDGNGPLGSIMAGHEPEWGLERAGAAGNVYLFRIL